MWIYSCTPSLILLPYESSWAFQQSARYLHFSEWFMKNVIIWPEKEKIMTLRAFCWKQNRDYTACLKNIVNFLLHSIHKMNFYGWFLGAFAYANIGCLKVKSKITLSSILCCCSKYELLHTPHCLGGLSGFCWHSVNIYCFYVTLFITVTLFHTLV